MEKLTDPKNPSGRKLHNYKQLKEAHVSNLSGGNIWEINEVTLVLPVSFSQERTICVVLQD